MTQTTLSGHCLCNAVSVTATLASSTFDACHCSMCRRWGGGPAFTIDPGKTVAFSGEENIVKYSSSAWAERGFCGRCGTHLFYRLKASDFCNVSLGLFDGAEALAFQSQIFIDAKPSHYAFANETELLTEAQVLAKFQ